VKLRPTPCDECPFTSHSMRGYSGPYPDIEDLIEIGISDADYPCHTDHQKGKLSLCNGAVGLMNNMCKLPRIQGATHEALMDHTSHSSVFKDTGEMLEYHDIEKRIHKKELEHDLRLQ